MSRPSGSTGWGQRRSVCTKPARASAATAAAHQDPPPITAVAAAVIATVIRAMPRRSAGGRAVA
ncbi:hypothetical protein M0M43_25310 [Pimelobacter simplex]|nr:hypothetical protein M0M43_25310 [Pimelobacter simplex]UUW98535.1 hypothetical protein M0M48_13960 [Pimelobacter simplex]